MNIKSIFSATSKPLMRTAAAAIVISGILIPASAWAVDSPAEDADVIEPVKGVTVSDLNMGRAGDELFVKMTVGLSGVEVKGNTAAVITPVITDGTNEASLKSIGIYSYRRYVYYERNSDAMATGPDEMSYRKGDVPDEVDYRDSVPFEEWMNGAELYIRRSDCGCCGKVADVQEGSAGEYSEPEEKPNKEESEFIPELVYICPAAETAKTRDIEGSALVAFPVDKTVIYPDYRDNTVELGKIKATIDSVKNDADVTITSVWLKGYASPESPYSHNRELAMGRTQAVKEYVQGLYHFGEGIITTDYEPENWEGLRKFVEESSLGDKDEILAEIDRDLDPDAKEWRIKSRHPESYKILLRDCYPALRHTDYRVSYTIQGYSDPVRIREIMETTPQKLSLNEFYIAAQDLTPGSEEFTEVFATAVRMYPDDEIANLNAANAEMDAGNLERAARYLKKAGDSAEAVYARGVLAIRNGDTDAARKYMEQAAANGLAQAGAVLKKMEEIQEK